MTVKELYIEGKNRLSKAGVRDYQIDSFHLLEWVTGISKGLYYANENQMVPPGDKERYLDLIEKRSKRIPLQHLTGVQEFMGLSFKVTPDVLIPRQDTETLVETALNIIEKVVQTGYAKDNSWSDRTIRSNKKKKSNTEAEYNKKYKVLDMCTGSGCIIVSILAFAKKLTSKIEGTGVDICSSALIIAEKNSKINMVETTLVKSDLFEKIEDKYHMIVSNPPYIKSSYIWRLDDEVKNHDPIKALDGGEDGLYFYREIINKSCQHLECGGHLLLEIGHDQGIVVSKKMEEKGFRNVRVIKDLANIDRVVLGTYNGF